MEKKRGTLNDFYYGLLPSLCIIGLFGVADFMAAGFWHYAGFVAGGFFYAVCRGHKLEVFFLQRFWAELWRFTRLLKLNLTASSAWRLFLTRPWIPKGISYQINQALLAIGSGGLWGFGYGLSRQKHNYLPAVINDSIFAVFAEELGFFRVLVALALFVLFALKGFQIAKNAPDTFGKMVAFGITSWITLQAFINIAAIFNLLPLNRHSFAVF